MRATLDGKTIARPVATCALVVISAMATPWCSIFAQGGAAGDPVAPFSSFYVSAGTILMNVSDLNFHFERPDIDTVSKRPGFATLANHGYTAGFGGYFPIM